MEVSASKILLMQNELANTTKVWFLFLFLGWSYGSLRKIGLQILFYITLCSLGFCVFIRLFTLISSIRSYNKGVCMRSSLSADEMIQYN